MKPECGFLKWLLFTVFTKRIWYCGLCKYYWYYPDPCIGTTGIYLCDKGRERS
jgi:hypothetical protein